MIKKILKASGVKFRETRFLKPPVGESYAVYMDDMETDGPDYASRIFRHDVTVELYAPKPDPKAEAALEAAIIAEGLHYRKQARYWIQEEQMYQTIYELSYIEKI